MPVPDPDPPPSPMKKIVVVIFAAALVLSCALTPNVEPQACEADYYRGVYTLCRVLNSVGVTEFIDCDTLIEQTIEKGWYELEAPGFEWPTKQDVSGLSVRK